MNRITILKDKLISFAYSESEKREVMAWFHSMLPELETHSILKLNTSEKGKALIKLCTAKSITIDEKQKSLQILE